MRALLPAFVSSARWVVALASAVAVVSCQPVATCQADAECAPDGVCTGGYCFVRAAGADAAVADAGRADAGLADASIDAGDVDAGPLDAGALEDAGVPFDAGSCLSCPVGYACDESVSRCVLVVRGLAFLQPDENVVFGGQQPVRIEVEAQLDAGAPLPATLPVVATPGDFLVPPLPLLPGRAAWGLDLLTPADSGVWELRATLSLLDAGFEATTTLTVDAQRPVIELFAEPPPARVNDGGFRDSDPVPMPGAGPAWKKDELVELRVESTRPLTVTPADFGVPVTSRPSCTTCPSTRSCYCFTLDLAGVELKAMRGMVDAGVRSLADALGNRSAPANLALPVTRFRWRRQLLEPNAQGVDFLQPPVLDPSGRVHVGAAFVNSNQGAMWQVGPFGQTRVDTNIDRVWSVPVVDGTTLYAQGENNEVRRYDTTQTGGGFSPLGGNICNNERWEGTPTVVDGRLFLLGSSGRVFAGTSTSSLNCENWGTQNLTDTGAQRGVVVGQLRAGTSARLYLARPMPSSTTGITRVDYFPSATPRFQGQLIGSNPQGSTSLVVFDEVVAASSRAASPRTTVAISAWSPDLSARVDARLASDAGTTFAPLVVAGPSTQPLFVLGDGLGALRRFTYRPPPTLQPDGGSFDPELPPILGVDPLEGGPMLGMAAPVLGASGMAYVVSPVTGRLSVVNVAAGTIEWSLDGAFTPGAVSPALDVWRDRALSKQCARPLGVLYVATRNDASLQAIIVDSPGLDGTAPWPRFHHDNANTGNPQTPLTPWACP